MSTIHFMMERENEGRIAFLDVLLHFHQGGSYVDHSLLAPEVCLYLMAGQLVPHSGFIPQLRVLYPLLSWSIICCTAFNVPPLVFCRVIEGY